MSSGLDGHLRPADKPDSSRQETLEDEEFRRELKEDLKKQMKWYLERADRRSSSQRTNPDPIPLAILSFPNVDALSLH